MLNTIFSRTMWVGRATVFMVGLAVILALTVGVAGAAFRANGAAATALDLQVEAGKAPDPRIRPYLLPPRSPLKRLCLW
jgi:hypothetical protein